MMGLEDRRQSVSGLRFIDESQFTYAMQDRDHGVRAGRAHDDTISYKRQAP